MSYYRVRLALRSGLGTPLAADTLWGHLAWGVRWTRGERALEQWLGDYAAGEPPLALSDPMPAGFLPLPLLPPPPPPAGAPDQATATLLRAARKASWIATAAWRTIAGQLSPGAVQAAVFRSPPAGRLERATVLHAAINRLSGGTAQEGGGTLFSEDVEYGPGTTEVDVWVTSRYARDEVERLFEAGLSGGYGRGASGGLGDLRLHDVTEEMLPACPGANAGVLLGPCVPRRGDPSRGYVQLTVRAGRLGGDFAIGPTPDGGTLRQKRPLRCLERGSVLVTPGDPPPTVGRLVSGVHDWPPIRHYGISLLLPCRLTDETLEAAA